MMSKECFRTIRFATILFVLAAFGVAFGVVSLIPLGLAFLAAAFVVN